MPVRALRQGHTMMKQIAICAGVFLVAAAILFGIFSLSVRYNRIATSQGTADCFKTTCH